MITAMMSLHAINLSTPPRRYSSLTHKPLSSPALQQLSVCRIFLSCEQELYNQSYTMSVIPFQHHYYCHAPFWVESFNYQLLMYVPKCVQFGTSTNKMRISLAIMDWVS